jgi:hypothetical protein
MLAITSAVLHSNLSTVEFNVVCSEEEELCWIAVFGFPLELLAV